jgi:phosphomevalonate kinase
VVAREVNRYRIVRLAPDPRSRTGAPIVEETLGLAASLAERCAGSAKPCGAGGGDVAVAFFVDADAAKRFELACIREGLHPIDVAWGALGVQAH